MPICLPPAEKFPDEKGIVYVAGWGLHHESTKDDCTTNEKGPDPFSKCKFPFFMDNLGAGPFNGCLKVKSPSSRNKNCQTIFKLMKKRKGNNVSFLDQGYGRVNTDIHTMKSLIHKLTTMFNTGPNFLYFWGALLSNFHKLRHYIHRQSHYREVPR